MPDKLISRSRVFHDSTGNDAAEGGTLEVYINGTMMLANDLTSDITGLIPINGVIPLGSDGTTVFDIYGSGLYRLRLLDSDGVQIWVADNEATQGGGGSGGGAGGGGTSVRSVEVFVQSPTQPPTPGGAGIPEGTLSNPPVDAMDIIWISRSLQDTGLTTLLEPWSPFVAFSATSISTTRYYILSLDGGIIKNGAGAVGFQLRRIDASGDNEVTSGIVSLYVGGVLGVTGNGFADGSTGYTVFLDAADINGNTVVEARSGSAAGQLLYTEPAVDLADGAATSALLINSPEGHSFVRAPNGGTWSDTLKPYPIIVTMSGVVVEETEVQASLNTGTGEVTLSYPDPNTNVGVVFLNNGSEAATIDATYLPDPTARASLTVQAVEGGDSGRDAVVANINYSQPSNWVQAPDGGGVTPATLTNDVTCVFQRGGTVLASSGLTATLDPATAAITVTPLLFDADVITGAQGGGTASIVLSFTFDDGSGPVQGFAPLEFTQGGSQGNSGLSPSAPVNFIWTVIQSGASSSISPTSTLRTFTATWSRDGAVVASRTTTAVLNTTSRTVSVTTAAGAGTTTATLSGDNSRSVTVTLTHAGIEIIHNFNLIEIEVGTK